MPTLLNQDNKLDNNRYSKNLVLGRKSLARTTQKLQNAEVNFATVAKFIDSIHENYPLKKILS